MVVLSGRRNQMTLQFCNSLPGWVGVNIWRQIFQISVGYFLYACLNFVFDYIFYFYIIYRFGTVTGGALMLILSMLICASTLIAYERFRIPWIGVNALHVMSQKENPNIIERLLVWLSRQNPTIIFLVLCIYQDPFITTAYFRGDKFTELSIYDWKIFFASVFVSNLYWIVIASGVSWTLVAF